MAFVATIRRNEGKTNICKVLLNTVTVGIHQILLRYKLVASKVVRQKLLDLNDITFASNFNEEVIKIKEYEEEIANHSRLQLGLETVFQVTGNAMLLFYAYSSTKGRQGLSALVKGDADIFFGVSFSPEFVIATLLVINLFGFIKVNMDCIVQGYASNYSLICKFAILLEMLCASSVRITSILMYFATTLGLFDLLHHYQGKHYYHT